MSDQEESPILDVDDLIKKITADPTQAHSNFYSFVGQKSGLSYDDFAKIFTHLIETLNTNNLFLDDDWVLELTKCFLEKNPQTKFDEFIKVLKLNDSEDVREIIKDFLPRLTAEDFIRLLKEFDFEAYGKKRLVENFIDGRENIEFDKFVQIINLVDAQYTRSIVKDFLPRLTTENFINY